jgi:hypothetical protein
LNSVITLSDKNYFDYGYSFIKTRKFVDAHFTIYGPNLTTNQIKYLTKHNIEYMQIPEKEFNEKMQFLKFKYIKENLDIYDNVSFIDFDTLFLKDWHDTVFSEDFHLGITVRNKEIKNGKQPRAYSNGGVIFAKKEGQYILQKAIQTVLDGHSDDYIEYDQMFKVLEDPKRPKDKIFHRTSLRWWVDQIFLSCIVSKYIKEFGNKTIKNKIIYKDNSDKYCLFNCDIYNKLDALPKDIEDKKAFILHYKNLGRDNIEKINKAVDKWLK